jgi:uncharacterized SAM-binding protein YcdF (DUF218 family)
MSQTLGKRRLLRLNVTGEARKRCWRLLTVFVVVAGLGTGAWVGRDWLLLSATDLWIVSDPIGPADAVAVFGGGIADRPFAAAQYYRQGLVKKVLVSNDVVRSGVPANKGVLLNLGVPASSIEIFGNDLTNTHQEVLALRTWAERNNASSIIVPTEIFSARRVRWMAHRAFGSEFVIRVIALDLPQNRPDDWWRHREAVAAFKTEVIKYLYYVLRY